MCTRFYVLPGSPDLEYILEAARRSPLLRRFVRLRNMETAQSGCDTARDAGGNAGIGAGDQALGDAGGNILKLTDSDGNPVLSATGQPIQINANQYMADRITVDGDGQLCYPDAANNPQPIPGMKIGLYQFQNPSGLKKEGDSVYSVTAASGMPINEENNNNVEKSQVRQGYLEGSNVQVADEMVNLIIAQRAYEFNSKAIQAADTMMQEANELRR